MKKWKRFIFGPLAAALVLAACAPKASASKESSASDAGPNKVAASAGQLPNYWYAAELNKLGFYVFPHPIDVGDFSVEALRGPPAKLSEQKGKIVLLNFWATWCPPCRAEMPSINRLWAALKGENFTIMALSLSEPRATVEKFIAENGYIYPIYLDGKGAIGTAFNASSIPTTYIIDKQGRAIAGIQGSKEYDDPQMAALLRELAKR